MRVKIKNLAEAEEALHPFYEVVWQTTGEGITLGRTERLMAHLGNPERQLRVVHIAGTSGKTSTTYYIADLLHRAGAKVGHTVSPHIHSLTERVQLNGKPITERRFCDEIAEFLQLIADAPETPSWFECMIAFTYWFFAKEGVDYAVMETGMGGLEDSTNVAARRDKVCVITDIGLDHTKFLGDTIGSIAHQKAGIIHEYNTALMYDQSPEIMKVIRYWVSQQEEAELLTFEQTRLAQAYAGAFVQNLPAYQKRNWLLAFAAYRYIAKRDGLRLLGAQEYIDSQKTHVPGRMDKHVVNGKTIVMDGAHNEQKMRTFVDSFSQLYPDRKVPVLLAVKMTKDIEAIAPILAEVASTVIVTKFARGQDMPDVASEPAEVAEVLKRAGVSDITIVNEAEQAYAQFLEHVDDLGIITGSFYLISQLQRYFL